MSIGKREARQILTAVRKLCGQLSIGPRGVACQLTPRINAPISPPLFSISSILDASRCNWVICLFEVNPVLVIASSQSYATLQDKRIRSQVRFETHWSISLEFRLST